MSNNYIDDVKEELLNHVKIGKGLQDVYALLVLVKGEDVTLKDVHDAWAVNINKTWDFATYGNHRSLIAFDELSEEIQNKDQKFVDAIKATARALNSVMCTVCSGSGIGSSGDTNSTCFACEGTGEATK